MGPVAVLLLLVVVLYAVRTKRNDTSKKHGRSFSDELYDYSMKSKGKIRNPHMSVRAMRHRMMKKR
jgi:hypothetical protein